MFRAQESTVGAPSLTYCAVLALARNMDTISSLQGVPQELVQELFSVLVSTHLLAHKHLPMLVSVNDARLNSYPGLSDDWLAYIGARFTRLTRLDLTNCIDCTDEGARHLRHLNLLKTLIVDRCLRQGDAALQAFARLTTLRTLSVGSCTRMASPGVACLTSLLGLTDLNLEQLARLDADGLRPLSVLTDLRALNLGWTCTTDDALPVLAHFKALKQLNPVSYTHLTLPTICSV